MYSWVGNDYTFIALSTSCNEAPKHNWQLRRQRLELLTKRWPLWDTISVTHFHAYFGRIGWRDLIEPYHVLCVVQLYWYFSHDLHHLDYCIGWLTRNLFTPSAKCDMTCTPPNRCQHPRACTNIRQDILCLGFSSLVVNSFMTTNGFLWTVDFHWDWIDTYPFVGGANEEWMSIHRQAH